MTDLAIYDMDRTLTKRPTYTPFLIHCATKRAPWRLTLLPVAVLSMLAYACRLIDRARLKEINQSLLIGNAIDARDLTLLAESFADHQLKTNIRPGALNALANDRSEGRRIVLATASYRLYADRIAKRLGFDDVIATNSVTGPDDRILAKIAGENCYGEAKMRMIAQWIEDSGLKDALGRVRFYSDHVSDRPVFEWADEPVAVNPDSRLERLAHEHSWRIEDWKT